MPRKQETPPPKDQVDQQEQRLSADLGQKVVAALGRLDNFFRVQVRPLWKDHYRVNVLVGADAASARVAHSYFLVTDAAGAILNSTPKFDRVS